MNIKRIAIISSLSLILLIGVVYLLFFKKEEKLEDISIQVKSVREMKDYDIPSLGQSVEDKIYDKYDTVKFGRYYQDKYAKQKLPIEWIVLEKRNDKVLLLSKYILDSNCMTTFDYIDEVYTWKESKIRFWLNNKFYDFVFDNSEKKKVLEVELENEYEESSTKDKVFLLSEKEFRKYFENGMYYEKLNDPDYDNPLKERIGYSYEDAIEMQDYVNAQTVGTEFAFTKGLYDYREGLFDEEDNLNVEPENTQSYWLRTPTHLNSRYCCRVDSSSYFLGIDETTPADYNGYGIRPAIWVSLEN